MNTVSGKVIIRETGVGIPDLQIVIYDIDQAQDQATHARPSESFGNVNLPLNAFWLGIPGDRIGSVLTNQQGEFEIMFEDREIEPHEQLPRPDLLLMVMAPEDTDLDSELGYIGQPPDQRILHLSPALIANAGRLENYIIRLPQASLEEANISIPEAPQGKQAYEQTGVYLQGLTHRMDRSFDVDQTIGDHLAHQLRVRQERTGTKAAADRSQAALANFLLSRSEHRDALTFASPREDVRERQIDVIDHSLDQVLMAENNVDRNLVLHLAPEVVRTLQGVTFRDDISGNGRVPLPELLRHTKRATGGREIQRFTSVFQVCRAALEDTSTTPSEGNGSTGTSGNGESGEGGTTLTPAQFVSEQIARQMEFVVPPEEHLKYGVERDGDISHIIKSFKLEGGPADVTAFHDFHSLQIAFENIWTEMPDTGLQRLGRQFYKEMVEFKHRVSGVDPEDLPEVGDVRDMRELLNEFESFLDDYVRHNPVPGSVKDLYPDETNETWNNREESEQDSMIRAADVAAAVLGGPVGLLVGLLGGDEAESRGAERTGRRRAATARRPDRRGAVARRPGDPPLDSGSVGREGARVRGSAEENRLTRLRRLMRELDLRLREPHRFDIFKPDSMNYGLMVTYRQTWEPLDYQVGRLVSTVPMAPKEVRRYTTKQVITKTRAEKELEDAQHSRRDEASRTQRADSEIVRRAGNKTNFSQTAEGTLSFGVFEGTFGTNFGVESERSSATTKKNFREAIVKAAEEYKQHRRIEVEIGTEETFETTTFGELINPNDEITVTYLFYELQRQYRISEQIHRLTPVILVANDVPDPDEIDEDWMIAHDWILRRVILDDSFLPPLNYLVSSYAGDELALQTLGANLERQAALVDELRLQLESRRDLATEAFAYLQGLMDPGGVDRLQKLKEVHEDLALAPFQSMETAMATAAFGPFGMLAGLFDNSDEELQEKREEAARLALERADKEVRELAAQVKQQTAVLQQATEKYAEALRAHFDRQVEIARLRIHIKKNILYYMQAIWDYEPTDQRFFRLYNLEVPWFEIPEEPVDVVIEPDAGPYGINLGRTLGKVRFRLPFEFGGRTTKTLHQVADLDNLLGYKGNYMIFPVKQSSYLHDYMMQDYIDTRTGGLRDPDEFAEYSVEDLIGLANCLRQTDPDALAANEERINELIQDRLTDPRPDKDIVVVPTDSLYIEALPGKHPIMEDFKLVHRALDVKKVQAQVRHDELENVRLAARLAYGEREDAEIDMLIQTDDSEMPHIDVGGDG
jgi:hypothetical protein